MGILGYDIRISRIYKMLPSSITAAGFLEALCFCLPYITIVEKAVVKDMHIKHCFQNEIIKDKIYPHFNKLVVYQLEYVSAYK